MAEKVSLLSSLPTVPVAEKSEETDSKIVLLSSSAEKDAKQSSSSDSAPTMNLLSGSSSSSNSQSSGSGPSTSLKLLSSSETSKKKQKDAPKAESTAVESVASTAPVGAEESGGGFGVVLVFGSFILIFVLVAVGAAVVTRKLSQPKTAAPASGDVPPPEAKSEPKSEVKPTPEPATQPVAQSQEVDPVVEFINSTPDPQVAAKPKKLPPRKPGANGANGEMPRPPKKPGSAVAAGTPKAPNAPSSIKAPSRPKKRF